MTFSTGISHKNNKNFLTGLLLPAGILHLLHPTPFDKIVPSTLPATPRLWTYLSGVAEIGLGAGIQNKEFQKVIARLSAVFFLAVFPANIKMALDWRKKAFPLALGAWLRLPLQFLLVKIALDAADIPDDSNYVVSDDIIIPLQTV